jgi:type IV secretion system protein VirD4
MRRIRLFAGVGAFVVSGIGAALAQGYNPYARPPSYDPSVDQVVIRVVIDVVTALIGLGIGAFFSPLLRPFRRIAFPVALVAGLLFAWFGPPPLADALAYLLAILLFFVAIGYGLRLGVKATLAGKDDPTSFGSAKWATEVYLRAHGLFAQAGFLLGTFATAGGRTPLFYTGARHLLTVAPTRSGKGVAAIIPNLLTYEGSVFIIDPKGENALVTACRRGHGDAKRAIPGLGQSVFLLDPWNIAANELDIPPARFNPLDWITADDPDAAENAFLLADALVPEGAEGEGRFWDDEAKALLTGIILYVATSDKEADNRHLGRVRDILLLDDDGFKAVLQTMYNEPLPVISSTAARTAGKEVKLRSNVIATVQSHTHFLDSPRIRESLSTSDFSFEDLKTKPTTVYLILPADRLKTFDRWLRLLIQQAITVNARNILVKPKKPVLFLLDEMASLGRLSMVEQAYGLMAGFGMQLWGIVQDLSQLERIYGDGWQTFISNSGVIQYFGSRDKITAEYFSTLCGVTTIRLFSFAYAIGHVFGSSNSGSSSSESSTHTTNSNESQRQLAYPDELMVLKDDAQIIFVENLDPISGVKVRWYEDAQLRTLGVNLQATSQPAVAYAPVLPEPVLSQSIPEPVLAGAPSPVLEPAAQTPHFNASYVDARQNEPRSWVKEADPESIRNDILSRFKRLGCGGGRPGRLPKHEQ